MAELSPAAKAVLEAAMNTPDYLTYDHDIAAALRAAALYCSKRDRLIILAIAAELETIAMGGELKTSTPEVQ